MAQPVIHFYEFGPFRLAPADRLLLRDDQPVPLSPKLFDLLVVLVEGHGRMLSKDKLMQTIWPDAFVEEGNLTHGVSLLRRALGNGENEQHYIETVPKHGYRFVAEVREYGNEDAELAARERIKASVVIEEETNGQVEAEAEPASLQLSQSKRWTSGRWSWRMAAAGVLLIGLILSAAYWWKSRQAKQTGLGEAVKSVAVLPFKPLKPDGDDEILGLGLADTLITRLSGLQSLIVRPTSAVRKYSSSTQDPLAAGREQMVDAVLDASLQRDGERIRVTVRLLSVRDGTSLWAYQCEEVRCDNLFAMQDAISEQVATALVPHLSGEERKRLRKHYTENREAYQAYMKGYYYSNRLTPDGLKKGIELLNQAIELDPSYALAYAGLAYSYAAASDQILSPNEAMPMVKAAALRALEFDETLGEAHTWLAYFRSRYEWNWAEAEKGYQRALELNPNYAPAHQWYGWYLAEQGRMAEAIAEMTRAHELDPLTSWISTNLAWFYYLARQPDEAIAQLRKIIATDPNFIPAHHTLGLAYQQKEMFAEAINEFNKARLLDPECCLIFLGNVYAISGRRDEARRMLDEVKKKNGGPWSIAVIYAGLGEKDLAFAWLDKTVESKLEPLLLLKVEPWLDSLRSDPRFTDLLRRLNLTP